VITCYLPRSACKTNPTTGTYGCNRQNDHTYLWGITVTFQVEMYDSDFTYWRGVSACSIVADERNYAPKVGDIFHETIIMNHPPQPSQETQPSKLAILFVLCVFLVYMTLYFCRRARCIVCTKKLVLFRERCYLCWYFDADPPDPILLRALEEKGEWIQGVPPENFPGSRRFVRIVSSYYVSLKAMCCCCLCCKRRDASIDGTGIKDIYIRGSHDIENDHREEELVHIDRAKKKKKKDKEKKKKVNPNLLPYPEHIIYAAVGHHDPPPAPDPKGSTTIASESKHADVLTIHDVK
jgi:hypothetical protein